MGFYEVETIEGLETFCQEEIEQRIPKVHIAYVTNGAIGIKLKARDAAVLTQLKQAIAVYSVERFDIPRPKALLGHQNFQQISQQIERVLKRYPLTFKTLTLQAAGSDSQIMQRIKQELAVQFHLEVADDQADVLIRIRKQHPDIFSGWEVLCRLTSRPLVTRSWRIHDYHGALNAVTANAMIAIGHIEQDSSVLNIGCGSGSLLIERYMQVTKHRGISVGIDIDDNVLHLAQENINEAGNTREITLISCDGSALPLMSHRFDHVVADFPFGQAIGSHTNNIKLYPILLQEAGRVTKIGGRAIIITHEIKLMEQLLSEQNIWQQELSIQINMRGLHPKIYRLIRQ